MSDTCETVRIVAPATPGNELGYVVINKSDLKPTDEIYGAPKPAPKPAPAPAPAPVAKAEPAPAPAAKG